MKRGILATAVFLALFALLTTNSAAEITLKKETTFATSADKCDFKNLYERTLVIKSVKQTFTESGKERYYFSFDTGSKFNNYVRIKFSEPCKLRWSEKKEMRFYDRENYSRAISYKFMLDISHLKLRAGEDNVFEKIFNVKVETVIDYLPYELEKKIHQDGSVILEGEASIDLVSIDDNIVWSVEDLKDVRKLVVRIKPFTVNGQEVSSNPYDYP